MQAILDMHIWLTLMEMQRVERERAKYAEQTRQMIEENQRALDELMRMRRGGDVIEVEAREVAEPLLLPAPGK